MTTFTPDHHASLRVICNLLLDYTFALLHNNVKDRRYLWMVACDRVVDLVRRLHGLVLTRPRRNVTYDLYAPNA